MPALIPTDHIGRITWLGFNPDRDISLRNQPEGEIEATFAGFSWESRSGLTRPSCSRVRSQYTLGTVIRNTRQFSVVSAEELAQIAANMGLETLNPAWIGASIMVEGIADFTHVPPSSRLQTQDGTTLVVDMENRPCHLPAKVIDEDLPGKGRAFKEAAKGLRGVTAWVECEGPLRVGDDLRLHIPDQRGWTP